ALSAPRFRDYLRIPCPKGGAENLDNGASATALIFAFNRRFAHAQRIGEARLGAAWSKRLLLAFVRRPSCCSKNIKPRRRTPVGFGNPFAINRHRARKSAPPQGRGSFSKRAGFAHGS